MRGTESGAELTILICYGLITALAAAYLVTRAFLVPMTYDEAATYLRYIDAAPWALFDFSVATNHLLNSVLTRLSSQLMGDAPWALRLPNVLAGVGYMACAGVLLRRADRGTVGLAGFVLMVANPYLLDYFSLSRGYGLAIALLTGSVYFLLRWLEQPPEAPGARRLLAWVLSLAATAVVATYTVLPAFLAVVLLVTAREAWTSFRGGEVASVSRRDIIPWRALAGWLVVGSVFSVLVFARHPVLSEQLFVPITVRVVGLFDDEAAQIRMSRKDAPGRWRPLENKGHGVWGTGDAKAAWGLLVELPPRIDANLTSLEVQIGTEVLRRDRRGDGPWQARDLGDVRMLDGTGPLKASTPGSGASDRAINWAGDMLMWRLSIVYAAGVLVGLAMLAVMAAAASAIAVRSGLLAGSHAGLVVTALMAVAAFSAAPLYLLRRDAQLYFGGTAGLVPDTFGSLIRRSAYGASYASNQIDLVLIALACMAVTVVGLFLASRRLRVVLTRPFAVLALIAFVALQVTLQHRLLGTPWLTGRTALFLLPLILLFVALTGAAAARFGSGARTLTTAIMLPLAAASIWHTVSVVNLTHPLDWPDDVATPAMLGEVAAQVATDGTDAQMRRDTDAQMRMDTKSRVVAVGVDSTFYAVARYYAARMSDATTRYDVAVVTAEEPPPEFVYTSERLDGSGFILIRGFSDGPAALWQLDRGRAIR